MKKIIRKVVVGGMALAMVIGTIGCGKTSPADVQEAPIAGGWEAAQDGTITEELQALFDKAMEKVVGVDYTPIELLETQVVAGTNYKFLCESRVVAPDAETKQAIVTIYEDLDGNVSVTDISDTEEQGTGGFGIANPFVEVSSLEEAAAGAGFEMEAPEEVEGFEGKRIFLKQRRRQSAGNQYTGGEASGHDDRLELLVTEYGVKYLVNLTDRIDTGIFPDYRLVRRYIREHAKGRSFLNLFCYTGTSSVAAALGGAASVVSVDMSSTYLDWTRENFRLNGIDTSDASRYRFVKADCVRWLRTAKDEGKKYDLVLFDPPTFSNSKSMSGVFSVQDDYLEMLRLISELLTDDGLIIFSNNYRGFTLDPEAVEGLGLSAEDVTARTIPEDYRRTPKIHCCYLVRKICR